MAKLSGYLAGHLASACVAMALLSAPAGAKFITFQMPGATVTGARAISSSGEVTGYFTKHHRKHGFIRAPDGTLTTIDVPGAFATSPWTIGDDGTIAGAYAVRTGGKFEWLGFVRTPDGQFTEFKAPRAPRYTGVAAIAMPGWVAGTGETRGLDHVDFGFLRDPSGQFTVFGDQLIVNCANSSNTTAGSFGPGSAWHGFVRTPDGTITPFDPDGATYTAAFAINNAGTTTGETEIAGIFEGFVRAADGTISTFAATQDAQSTGPTGINKTGAIAGSYADKDGINHGFVRAPDGTITTIDVPGGSGTLLNGINDKGEAAGTFVSDGVQTGFIWKP